MAVSSLEIKGNMTIKMNLPTVIFPKYGHALLYGIFREVVKEQELLYSHSSNIIPMKNILQKQNTNIMNQSYFVETIRL